MFTGEPPARVLVEASTESELVACHLEALGHEVIVADPNFAPMYATRGKKIKTDKRDARALCEACRLGAYRHAHHTSERQRRIGALLRRGSEKNGALYDRAMRIAARRGRARARVALVRKLAGILYGMWRDGAEFNPQAPRASVTAATGGAA